VRSEDDEAGSRIQRAGVDHVDHRAGMVGGLAGMVDRGAQLS